mmetsp:Transcript_11798/g.21806  ORF Transcript_11798/g.21806 Transcript_11798/m.21806 type:complete len:246 (-) Transcript_11798:486-1223(-)
MLVVRRRGAGHGGNLLHGRSGRVHDAILGGIGNGVVRWTAFESPNVQFAVGVLGLLGQDHGGTSLAILHVDTLGVGHEEQVDDALVAPVSEGEVEGQHALIVLACRTLREREQQRRDSTFRRAEDDGSMEGQQSPTQLPIRLLPTDPRTRLMRTRGRTLHGPIPVLTLHTQVKVGGVGIVIALKDRTKRRGGSALELRLVEAHDASATNGSDLGAHAGLGAAHAVHGRSELVGCHGRGVVGAEAA